MKYQQPPMQFNPGTMQNQPTMPPNPNMQQNPFQPQNPEPKKITIPTWLAILILLIFGALAIWLLFG